jgi:hypothetical protein
VKRSKQSAKREELRILECRFGNGDEAVGKHDPQRVVRTHGKQVHDRPRFATKDRMSKFEPASDHPRATAGMWKSVAQNCGISGPFLGGATPSGLNSSAWRFSALRPQFYHQYRLPHAISATAATPSRCPNVSKSVAFFDRWLSNSRSRHNLIAGPRIQPQSENSEIGIEIEIEFSDNLRLNPGDANMSFQLLIRPVSGEDTGRKNPVCTHAGVSESV